MRGEGDLRGIPAPPPATPHPPNSTSVQTVEVILPLGSEHAGSASQEEILLRDAVAVRAAPRKNLPVENTLINVL